MNCDEDVMAAMDGRTVDPEESPAGPGDVKPGMSKGNGVDRDEDEDDDEDDDDDDDAPATIPAAADEDGIPEDAPDPDTEDAEPAVPFPDVADANIPNCWETSCPDAEPEAAAEA